MLYELEISIKKDFILIIYSQSTLSDLKNITVHHCRWFLLRLRLNKTHLVLPVRKEEIKTVINALISQIIF